MKLLRLALIALALALLPTLAGTTHFSRQNGDADTAATWSTTACNGAAAGAPPGATDAVQICGSTEPNSITIDSTFAAASFLVDNGASLTKLPGVGVTIGAGATGTNNVVVNGVLNVLGRGDWIMSADSGDQANDQLTINGSGTVNIFGIEVYRGRLTSEPDEAIPGEADILVTDLGLGASTDEHKTSTTGRVLQFLDGDAHTLVYDIASNTRTTLTLDQTADSHGHDISPTGTPSPYIIDDTSTVTCSDGGTGLTTVTADASPDALWDDVPASGRCNADTSLLGECFKGQDIEVGGGIYHIIDFTDVGASTQDQFKVRGDFTCTTASYVLRHWNAPIDEAPGWVPTAQPNATRKVRLSPHAGDRFVIYEKAVWKGADCTANNDALYTATFMAAGSTINIRQAEYGCAGGAAVNGIDADAIDNSATGEGIHIDYAELHHMGSGATLEFKGLLNFTSSHVWERDSVYEASGTGHGLQIATATGSRASANWTLDRWRWTRMNDEPATIADTTNNLYPDEITIRNSTFEYISWGPLATSAGGFEIQCGTDMTIERNVFLNGYQAHIALSNSDATTCINRVVIRDNAFLNGPTNAILATASSIAQQRNTVATNNYVE